MTTYKHTPGPWAVGQYTPTDNFKAIPSHACVCDPKTMALIATTGPADDRQSQIDADLIAAAPDLLEILDPDMLEAIANEIGSEHKHSARAHSLRVIARRQRAAIAKATGAQ